MNRVIDTLFEGLIVVVMAPVMLTLAGVAWLLEKLGFGATDE